MAYDRYWSRTMVIDIRFYFYLAAILDLILFPLPLTPAQSLVIDLSISIGAAKCLQHHYFLKFFMFAAPLQCTLADLPTMWENPPTNASYWSTKIEDISCDSLLSAQGVGEEICSCCVLL